MAGLFGRKLNHFGNTQKLKLMSDLILKWIAIDFALNVPKIFIIKSITGFVRKINYYSLMGNPMKTWKKKSKVWGGNTTNEIIRLLSLTDNF